MAGTALQVTLDRYVASNTSDENEIVTPPSRLCICGHEQENKTDLSAFPGQTFTVPLVAMNEFNKPMKAVVIGTVCKSHSKNDRTLQEGLQK